MKIATFNINNINRRLPNLLRWLRAAKPDVVCLQELKSTDADFPIDAIEKCGYGAVWRGQKTWNGVAILARNADPVLIRTELPGGRDDNEARYIEAAVNGIIVTSLYLPNGNPQPGPKFDYKLDWFRRLRLHGLIERIPHTFRYQVTDTGLAQAVFLTRLHDRFLRTGLASLADLPGAAEIRAAGLLDHDLPPDIAVPDPSTAAPDDEPPGTRVRSRGLPGVPKCGLAPIAPRANSVMLVLATMTAPPARSRRTTGASAAAGWP